MRLLSYVELKSTRGIRLSRVQLRRLVKDKKFPAPLQISESRIGWIESEVDAWLAEKAAQRSVGPRAAKTRTAAISQLRAAKRPPGDDSERP